MLIRGKIAINLLASVVFKTKKMVCGSFESMVDIGGEFTYRYFGATVHM